MSDYEHYKGKLLPLNISDGLKNAVNRLITGLGKRDVNRYPDPIEQLEDDYYHEYVIIEGKLYEIVENDGEISIASNNEDGTISFEVRFYNGGCSYSEALENAVDNNDK